ncbi:MAG: hypothetical protein V4773_17710 [Verrucomicrobiota bacterium]
MKRLLLGILLAVAPGLQAAEFTPVAQRFSFVAMGCMPYLESNYAAYERLLAEINRQKPAFAVHLGDIKAGAAKPTDEGLVQVRKWFDSVECPLMYTPGDNEWTDVHRTGDNPLVWLGKVRELFFKEERSLGKVPMKLVTQRRDWAHEKFVENARWSVGGVVFATVHVVGSNNNRDEAKPEALQEFRERDEANRAWVTATFAEAKAKNAPGVALFFQALPFSAGNRPVPTGFVEFLDTIEREALAFAKPVLLVHADEHRYRNDRAMKFRPDGEPVANVSRLETFGAHDIHGVLVVVDPASTQVFLSGPLWVAGNALPGLPPAKK